MWIWSRDFPWVPEITNNFREKQTASLSPSLSHPPSHPFPIPPDLPPKKEYEEVEAELSGIIKMDYYLAGEFPNVFLVRFAFKQQLSALSSNNYPLNPTKDDCCSRGTIF